MVGLVLVSHSKKLAEAVRDLVLQMTTPGFPVAVAAGVGDDFTGLGTDAVHIADVVQILNCPEGVLILMDMGSAVLSAQTALELLDSTDKALIRLCPAPLVEGAIAAAVSSQAGRSLSEVAAEAQRGLIAKQQQLDDENTAGLPLLKSPTLTAPGHATEVVLTIENQHGLHARPAAALVQTASRFTSTIEISNLTGGRGPVSARSITSLALLGIRKGDRIKVTCHGADCPAALQAIRELASRDFGEPSNDSPVIPVENVAAQVGVRSFPGADGIAIGPLAMLRTEELPEDEEPAASTAEELEKLTAAMKSVNDSLHVQNGGVPDSGVASGSGAILATQAFILDDPAVLAKVESMLYSGPVSAAEAWTQVTRELAAQYEAMDDAYLRERAADVRDLSHRVLRSLRRGETQPAISPSPSSILFADELLPSEAAACDPASVLGVITAKGSTTAHSAILLRTLGIPMVVGAVDVGNAAVGKTVAIDGSTGEVWIEPDQQVITRLQALQQTQIHQRAQAQASRKEPSVTLDGTHIEVLANAGNAQDATIAGANAADGIGLLRTEFLFVSRQKVPSEDEQVQALREIYAPISGPIVVRTLDVGADKPLAFLPQPAEHNPYLGARGIRLSLRAPDLFLPHLRAILRSGVGHEIWLMFPMIAVIREVREALQLLDEAHDQLRIQGIDHVWPIRRGVMIEVPSAAMISGQLAELLDFFSIGTNDLTQYTMAAERGNAAVADLQDALHPAVLQLMKDVVEGASLRKRHVSVCGDAASDPLAAAIFAGLGIRSLSVRPNRVAEIKALFRQTHIGDLREACRQALQCPDAGAVRGVIRNYLNTRAASRGDMFAATRVLGNTTSAGD